MCKKTVRPGRFFYSALKLAVAALVFSSLVACSSLSSRTRDYGSDEILRQMQQGKRDLNNKNPLAAQEVWVKAANKIDAVWTQQAGAEKASSLWYAEHAKDFRGEPYERMMLFFYLGVLFYNQADFGNAQAAFKQVSLQAIDQEEKKASYFRLAVLLEAFSLKALGNESSFQNLIQNYQKTYGSLPFSVKNLPNYLAIVETGQGPQKKWSNDDSKLYYVDREALQNRADVQIKLDGKPVEKETMPLFALAEQKGLREADKYAQTKKTTKDLTGALGEGGVRVGSNILGSSDDSRVNTLAAALVLAGLASMIVSGNVVVEGDLRYWENLPGSLHYGFFRIDKPQTLSIETRNASDVVPVRPTDRLKILYYPATQ